MSPGRGDAGGSPRATLSSQVCSGVAVWFAVWTVCAHATVAAGGSLNQLLIGFAVAILVVGGALLHVRRPADPPPWEAAVEPRPRSRWSLQLAGGVVGLGLAIAAITVGDAASLWWSVVGLLGAAAAIFLLAEPAQGAPPLHGRWPELTLWALAALCALVAVAVHRPDIDDTFYVNVAVAAADAPNLPLLTHDTMLGDENLPLHMPAHRIHTYELWNGALARLTGVPAILVFHWIAAAFFGALLPLAHAKLFRLLTPRVWPACVAVLLVVLLGVGETHRWYGNFALVRMWQGKAIFLFVFLPLVYAYAIEFALRPSLRRWGLLWAAQTAAVGCTSSAVWAAPVAAFVALCCVVRPTPEGFRRFALGALASFYALGIGFLLKGDVQGLLAPMISPHPFGTPLGIALRATLGGGAIWAFGVTTVLVAWSCCGRGLAQRFAIAVPLAVWLVLLNPYAEHWIAANLTGPSYWRAMWSLPVPILMTLVLSAPLQLGRSATARASGAVACAAVCTAFWLGLPAYSALSSQNGGAGDVGIRVGRPAPKAPDSPYRWASALNAAVPAGARVVAPADVSVWIPTFHHHAHPLQARKLYLVQHTPRLGKNEVILRLRMTQYVGGVAEGPEDGPYFERGLVLFDVKGVLLRNSGNALEARTILEQLGFERTHHAIDHEIWVRP